MQKKINVLITGSSGGLGTHLVKLLEKNTKVNLLTPSSYNMNLLDKGQINSYLDDANAEIIIHLASLVFGLKGNLKNQFNSLFYNSLINLNFLSAISELKNPPKKIFFAGTAASYGYPYQAIPLVEKDFFSNTDPHYGEFGYAHAKKSAYPFLHLLKKEKNIDFLYGIFTNMYGEFDRFNTESGHVIPSLIKKAFDANQNNKSITFWGSKETTRDFIHFSDAARAIEYLLMNQDKVTNEPINISSGVETNLFELCQLIAQSASLDDKINIDQSEPTGILRRVLDNKKLLDTGFSLTISLNQGIQKLYQWYTKNPNYRS